MILMKKNSKMHKFNSQKCPKNLKNTNNCTNPDISSLKTSQDISLVNIYSFYVEHLCHKAAQNASFFDICGVTYGTIFHKNCLVKALLLKSSQCKTCLIKI